VVERAWFPFKLIRLNLVDMINYDEFRAEPIKEVGESSGITVDDNDGEVNAKKITEFIERTNLRIKREKRARNEVPSCDRNFDTKILEPGDESTDEVRIKLIHKETSEEIDLASFLPTNYSFTNGPYKHHYGPYENGKGIVTFPADQILNRNFFLHLFHEIGHAHYQKKIVMEPGQPPSDEYSAYTKEKYSTEGRVQSERNAWAFALKTLRQLESKGYNVFGGFKDDTEIEEFVHFCLYTYDWDLIRSKTYDRLDDVKNALGVTTNKPFSKNHYIDRGAKKISEGYIEELKK
jgi:hypothetical protein